MAEGGSIDKGEGFPIPATEEEGENGALVIPQSSRRTNEYRIIRKNYTTIIDHLSSKEVFSRVAMRAFEKKLISKEILDGYDRIDRPGQQFVSDMLGVIEVQRQTFSGFTRCLSEGSTRTLMELSESLNRQLRECQSTGKSSKPETTKTPQDIIPKDATLLYHQDSGIPQNYTAASLGSIISNTEEVLEEETAFSVEASPLDTDSSIIQFHISPIPMEQTDQNHLPLGSGRDRFVKQNSIMDTQQILRSRVQSLEEDISRVQQNRRCSPQDHQRICTELNELKMKLNLLREKIDKLQTERQENLELENIYVANAKRIADLEKGKEQLEKRKEESDNKIGELEKGREVAERNIEELEDRNDESLKKIEELEKGQEDSQKKIEELKDCNEELKDCNEELKDCNEELKDCNEDSQKKIEELKNCNEDSQKKIDELEKSKHESDQNILELKEDFEELKVQSGEQLMEKQAEITEIEGELEDLKEQFKKLQQVQDSSTTDHARHCTCCTCL